MNSRPREVIGIMPPGADVLDIRPEIWLPLGLTPSNRGDRRSHSLRVIGRLKDGVSPEAALTELKTLSEHWGERVGVTDHMFAPMPHDAAARASNPNAGHMLQMRPLHEQIVGDASRAIWMLQATAGLVLVIACANLANLLLPVRRYAGVNSRCARPRCKPPPSASTVHDRRRTAVDRRQRHGVVARSFRSARTLTQTIPPLLSLDRLK